MPSDWLFQATRDKINEALSQIGSDFLRQENDMALIVNGAALKQATSYELSSSFLDLALSCKSVVCCRVSPIQKAEIVDLVRTIFLACDFVICSSVHC